MVLPDNIEAMRTRLASRTSFFGGAISTRDHARVASWKDLPLVKAATAGKSNAANPSVGRVPPRLKLTTAAAEISAADNAHGKLVAKKKGKTNVHNAANSKIKAAAATATTAAAASALIQRTPPETHQVKQRTALLEDTLKNGPARKPRSSRSPAPLDDTSGGTMLRHQQMTSLGVQTVQLLCIPTSKAQKKHPLGEDPQNEMPKSTENPPSTIQEDALGNHKKLIASPRRHHATLLSLAPKAPKTKIKQRLKGTFYGSAQPPAARHRIKTVDDDSDSDLDSFIETDDEEDEEVSESDNEGGNSKQQNSSDSGPRKRNTDTNNYGDNNNNNNIINGTKRTKKPRKWKVALKEALNGYDASKFAEVDAKPDRRMHASYEDIIAEETRAGKIGRAIDRIEAEKEAAARAAEKEEQREQREKRRLQNLIEDSGDSSSDEDGVLSDSSDDEGEDSDGVVDKHVRKKRKRLAGFLASF